MHAYHPDTEPTPNAWLNRSADARRADIAATHAAHGWDDRGDPDMHALEHEVLETALARNQPPGLRQLVGGLVGGGLSRHQALHALCWSILEPLRDHHAGRPADFDAALARNIPGQLATFEAIGTVAPEAVIDWLAARGYDAPDDFASRLIELRMGELGPAFVALLEDPEVRAPGHPRAAALAWIAEAVSLLDHTPAIGPVIEALAGTPIEHIAHDQLSFGLPRFGDRAVGPVLARLDRFAPEDAVGLLCTLVGHGARDPRLRPALLFLRGHAPVQVAHALSDLKTPGFADAGLRMHCAPIRPEDFAARLAELASLPGAVTFQPFDPDSVHEHLFSVKLSLPGMGGIDLADLSSVGAKATRKRKRRRPRKRWRIRRD